MLRRFPTRSVLAGVELLSVFSIRCLMGLPLPADRLALRELTKERAAPSSTMYGPTPSQLRCFIPKANHT